MAGSVPAITVENRTRVPVRVIVTQRARGIDRLDDLREETVDAESTR